MFFNSSYHWLLIEEDYTFNRKSRLYNNNDNNKNDNSMLQEINSNNNYKNNQTLQKMVNIIKKVNKIHDTTTISNNNEKNQVKHAKVMEKALGNVATTIISYRLPRKLKPTSIDITTMTTTTKLAIQAKKLLPSTYLQQQIAEVIVVVKAEEQGVVVVEEEEEEGMKLLHLTKAAATTTNQSIAETIDNNLNERHDNSKSNNNNKTNILRCNDKGSSSSSCNSDSLIAMNVQTRRKCIDDDGHNIEIIEKFLEQLEININTELILAKRKWHQQQEHISTMMMTAASHCVNKDAADIDVVVDFDVDVEVEVIDVNVNVDDIVATTKGCLKRGNKHFNNDTSVYMDYDAHTSSLLLLSSSSALYMPTDDYLLYDIW